MSTIPLSSDHRPRSSDQNDASHKPARRRRAWWHINAREARVHAYIVASLLWATAAVIAFTGSGYRSVFGPLKGSDFIQFYTLGHIDRANAPTVMYYEPPFHRLQTTLVPESDPEHYLVVYPPMAALLFRPLASLSYGAAALLWAAVLMVGYASCLWLAWKPFSAVLPDRRLLIAAAAAFPPFWYLVLHGQTTIVPLVGFTLGWLALERGRPFWAGAAFGLLLLKPQFVLVLVPVVLICAEWRMMAGAAASVAAQLAIMIASFGTPLLLRYILMMRHAGDIVGDPFLEAKQEQMHSIAAITNRLPSPLSTVLWVALAAVVVWKTVGVWRANVPVSVRVGVLVLASTLVNPHVFHYDATVLALPLLWFAAWLSGERRDAHRLQTIFVGLIYLLFISILAPTARFIPVQISVICLGGMFVMMVRAIDSGSVVHSEAANHDQTPHTIVASSLRG